MSFEYWLKFFREANIEEDCAPVYANIFVNHRITPVNVLLLNNFYLNLLGIECIGHVLSILGLINKKKGRLLHTKAQPENDKTSCERDNLNPCGPAIEVDHSSELAYNKLHKAGHTSLTILEKKIKSAKSSQDHNPISSSGKHEPKSEENLHSRNLPEQNNNCRDMPEECVLLANEVTSVPKSSWMGYLKHRLQTMKAENEAEMETNSGTGPSFPLPKKSCLRPEKFDSQSILNESHPRRRQVKFQPKSPDVFAFEVQYKKPHFHMKKDRENYKFPSLLSKNHCLSLMAPEDLIYLARKFSPSPED